jgi:hypothetical protein
MSSLSAIFDLPKTGEILRHWTKSITVPVEVTMARFTLVEKPVAGDEIPDSAAVPPHTWIEGELWRIIQRPLLNRNGTQQRGTFSVIGHVARVFPNNDPLMAVNGTNRITGRGDISTQGLFRFSAFVNPVIISIIGGTGDFKKARGTVTLDQGQFTFRVS